MTLNHNRTSDTAVQTYSTSTSSWLAAQLKPRTSSPSSPPLSPRSAIEACSLSQPASGAKERLENGTVPHRQAGYLSGLAINVLAPALQAVQTNASGIDSHNHARYRSHNNCLNDVRSPAVCQYSGQLPSSISRLVYTARVASSGR